MRWSETEIHHMQRALTLAARGLFTTTPNPRVGCVIVKDGKILGEGWHQKAGEAHAEVAALADARTHGHDVRDATMLVSLEPCSHHGQTPPCTEAIIAAGIGRVIAACTDPNPEAARGGQALQAAGVAFDSGLLEEEARELNCGFISRMQRGRPWVRSKIAASLDGRTALADGRSQWITQSAARDDGHAFRARACAVLTGIGTVLADDPSLTVQAVETSRQPLRIVLDRLAKIPTTCCLMSDGGDTMIVTATARPPSWPSHIRHLRLPVTGAFLAQAQPLFSLPPCGGGCPKGAGEGERYSFSPSPPAPLPQGERGGEANPRPSSTDTPFGKGGWSGAKRDVSSQEGIHSNQNNLGAEGRYSSEDLRTLMIMLAKLEVNELHVEAGARLNGALLEAGLVDELLVYFSPKILGQQALPMFEFAVPLNKLDTYANFSFMEAVHVGEDVRLRLKLKAC